MAPPKSETFMSEEELCQFIDEKIETKLREVIREEIKNAVHTCVFSDAEQKHIGEYVTTISRLGEGNFDKGFMIMQENHQWLKEQRERGSKITSAFFIGLVTAIGAAIIGGIFEFFKRLASHVGP